MKDRFEERLNECLEALAGGYRSLEECLSLYPDDADRLEPLLRTALFVSDAMAVEPRPEFAARARRHLLRVTEPRLRESLAVEPSPSFVMATRRRFMAAAQQVFAGKTRRRWLPAFSLRLATSATAAVVVMGFGSFVVKTSADALPGDWQYPVKRTTEDIRLTLTFGDGARREYQIDLANERLTEIEGLAKNGRPIGEGPLDALASQTGSLTDGLDRSSWNADDARAMTDLALRQQAVLANVAPLVPESARDDLAQAQTISSQTYMKAAAALVSANEDGTENPEGTAGTATPEGAPTATPTPGSEVVTPPEDTPEGEGTTAAEPTPIQVTPIPGSLVLVPMPGENSDGLSWDLVVIDRFSVQVPSAASGWHLMGLEIGPNGVATAPFLLRTTNADSTAIIVVNPRNGNTYWEQYKDGTFQELLARQSDGPILRQASIEELTAFSPENADLVLHIINSIVFVPAPTPTPTPAPTSTPVPPSPPAATVVASNGAGTP